MAVHEYKCPCCGGGIVFNSAVQKMKCPFCDTEFEMETLEAYDEELEKDARRHRPRTLRHAHEVVQRERRAHPEHDDLDGGRDKLRQLHAAPGREGGRKRERHRRAGEDGQAEPAESEFLHDKFSDAR